MWSNAAAPCAASRSPKGREVINLEPLLIKAYNLEVASMPFGPPVTLDLPARPPEPFRAHTPTIERLMRQYASFAS